MTSPSGRSCASPSALSSERSTETCDSDSPLQLPLNSCQQTQSNTVPLVHMRLMAMPYSADAGSSLSLLPVPEKHCLELYDGMRLQKMQFGKHVFSTGIGQSMRLRLGPHTKQL